MVPHLSSLSAFAFTPALSAAFTASILPALISRLSCNSFSRALPADSNNLTVPFPCAISMGNFPSTSRAAASAPAVNNIFTAPALPLAAAICKAVRPNSSVAFTCAGSAATASCSCFSVPYSAASKGLYTALLRRSHFNSSASASAAITGNTKLPTNIIKMGVTVFILLLYFLFLLTFFCLTDSVIITHIPYFGKQKILFLFQKQKG